VKLKKLRYIGIILVLFCFFPVEMASACTIFTVTDGQSFFFCGNEDNSEAFQWIIWFDPATENRYGRAFLGFRIGNNLDVPMAGINDQGLAIDLSAVSYAPINHRPERDTYEGAIFTKWLADCATVDQVREQLSKYNVIDLEKNPNQIHVADETGNAMVIAVDSDGELNTTNISGGYLVSTNFNLNNKDQLDHELHHSGRYNRTATGLETLLRDSTLGVEGCRDILDKVALNPGLGYGYIVDLVQGRIYIYSHDDFERTAVLDIDEELTMGGHSYALETLVTQQSGVIGPYIRNSLLISSLIIVAIFSLVSRVYFKHLKPLLGQERTRLILVTIFAVIFFVLLKTLVKIGPIYITFDWTSTIYIYITIFPVLLIATNFRSSMAFILSSVALIVDELSFCLLNGYGGELWIQLILTTSSLVGLTIIISRLRGRNRYLAFFLGAVWYLVGFFVPAYLYYCVMFYYDPIGLLIYSVANVVIYLAFIPIVLIFNKAFQILSSKKDLEHQLFSVI